MSNKFNKLLIMTIFVFITIKLYGFEPKASDFINSYQYELYRSWLESEKLDGDLPAGFTSEKIVRSFLYKNGREINVEYDWENWKISSQREIVPFLFYIDDEQQINSYINFIESFIYRLNCNDKMFITDLVDHNKIILEYKEQIGENALDLMWEERPIPRLKLQPVELITNVDTLGFIFISDKMSDFMISFPQVYNIKEIISEIRKCEFTKSEKYFPPIIEPEKEEIKTQIKDLTLAEYIRNYFETPPRRELLHNKIKDIHEFLALEFPNHSISNEKNIWYLEIDKFEDKLDGDISFELEKGVDMINIFPLNDLELDGKKIKLGSDNIDMSSLSETEISHIANYLPQLIYEHRAIGSKLMNFLLIHDEASSTLVVYSDKRELYETDSYSDILLLLNEYWNDRTVYFGIDSIKKISGTIEFKGFLVARTQTGSCDIAEIFFHVSKEYKIDLIMMILHPAENNKR
ncbi:MAG: hypothetical protein KAS53_06825 [Candidatus Cloacimonetes bacterium]|nr:hypothetical protein [Candidatus Cloacimonadota bacterium]